MATNHENNIDGVRTWVQVSKVALKHNHKVFRNAIAPHVKLMAVAKSNAYGHDMTQFALFQQELGVDWVGVDSIVEAVTLREAGVTVPMLVLGYTLPARVPDAVLKNVSITVSSMDALQALCVADFKGELNIHLKIDTGMGRQGVAPEEVAVALEIIMGDDRFVLEGVYTHFSSAKNPHLKGTTEKQLALFNVARAHILTSGTIPLFHSAATGGTLLFPESHFDMVRIGIGLYGLWPASAVRAFCEDKMQLKPALSWKTRLSEVKIIKDGEGVGYDLTERAHSDTKIGICPVGYWHGYARAYSGVAPVVINGKRARVMGRVSMDMIAINLNNVPSAKMGDEVELLGETVSAEHLAGISDTINYEVVTRINPLMRRVYVE
ncbi:MAG: alanine racemase [bacterium]|nr:alanine racemase [bacterium]